MKKFVIVLGALLTLIGCKKTPVCDCFDSAGSPSSTTRQVPYFDQVVDEDNINLHVATGSPEQVIIKGGKNLIPNIGAAVSGGVLTLTNNNICNWLRSYKKSGIDVYITMPRITYLTNNGYGTIYSTGVLNADTFQVATSNSGDINLNVHSSIITAHLFNSGDLYLTGACGVFLCNYFNGTGFVYADKLQTGYTFLSTSTIGDCYVNSAGGLGVVINTIGNVYYSGNPTSISKTINGSGQLIAE